MLLPKERKMSDVAKCPCCSASAKVIRDETGQATSYRALQDEDLIKKITQLKKALHKLSPSKAEKETE